MTSCSEGQASAATTAPPTAATPGRMPSTVTSWFISSTASISSATKKLAPQASAKAKPPAAAVKAVLAVAPAIAAAGAAAVDSEK